MQTLQPGQSNAGLGKSERQAIKRGIGLFFRRPREARELAREPIFYNTGRRKGCELRKWKALADDATCSRSMWPEGFPLDLRSSCFPSISGRRLLTLYGYGRRCRRWTYRRG